MSRSKRRNPFCGHTCASSDKIGKQEANRRFRKQGRMKLQEGRYEELWFTPKQSGGPWEFPKDGKQDFRDLQFDEDPEYKVIYIQLMRK